MKSQLTPAAVAVAAAFAAAGLVRPAAAATAADPTHPLPAHTHLAADDEHGEHGEHGEKEEMEEKDEEGEHGEREKSMKLADAPAAVKATVDKEASGGAKLTKISKEEEEDGKTVYEAEMIKDGQEMSVNISADGKVIERETKIKKKDLPKGAMKAIKAKYAGGKVGGVEKVEKDGKTSYEVAVTPADSDEAREITLDADGKIVKDEEAD